METKDQWRFLWSRYILRAELQSPSLGIVFQCLQGKHAEEYVMFAQNYLFKTLGLAFIFLYS